MTKHQHHRRCILYVYLSVLTSLIMVVSKVQFQTLVLLLLQDAHKQEAVSATIPVLRQSSLRSVSPSKIKPLCPPEETFYRQPSEVLSRQARPCALLFFGLPKQFSSLVLPSVEKNILAHNAACDIYAHAYNVSSVSSARNKESNSFIDATEIMELTQNAIFETNEDFLAKRDVEYYRQDRSFHKIWDGCVSSVSFIVYSTFFFD